MSISVYYGRAGSGKTRAVYERIRQVMTDCPGEPIILLVPEPATYRVERELAEFMPEKGFTTVRVVGFGRLGYQVYQSIGSKGVGQSSLSSFGRSMLLRLVMKRKQKELGLLEQATKRPEFSSVLQQLFSEFRAFRVGPADLERGAESVKNKVLFLESIAPTLTSCSCLGTRNTRSPNCVSGFSPTPVMAIVNTLCFFANCSGATTSFVNPL